VCGGYRGGISGGGRGRTPGEGGVPLV